MLGTKRKAPKLTSALKHKSLPVSAADPTLIVIVTNNEDFLSHKAPIVIEDLLALSFYRCFMHMFEQFMKDKSEQVNQNGGIFQLMANRKVTIPNINMLLLSDLKY